MESTLPSLGDWPPSEKLHAALRRLLPQAAASILRTEEGEALVRVTYRDAGPASYFWDGRTYCDAAGVELAADAEEAARMIAAEVGAAG